MGWEMRKLEKREIVILAITALAILYGVFNFLLGKSVQKPAVSSTLQAEEFKNLVGEITTAMSVGTLSVGEAYGISRAEAEWQHDPFYEKKTYREMLSYKETAKAGKEVKEKIAFNYTGYMEYGGRKVAIINSIEYSEGEKLETPGYVLKAIFPGKVIIENALEKTNIEAFIQD